MSPIRPAEVSTDAAAVPVPASFEDALLEIEQLREAMTSRASIEQAKGVIMAQEGVDADGAFAALRTLSQHRNIKLRDLAQQVVAHPTRPWAADVPNLPDGGPTT